MLGWRPCLTVLGICLVLALSWWISLGILAGHDDQTRFVFWLQTLSGNWSPVPRPGWISDAEYSASAIIAVVINYGPWIAIFSFIGTVVALDRRRRMTLGEALQAYDIAVRAEIIRKLAENPPQSLEDAAARIDEGLAEGRRQAIPIIQAVGGRDAVGGWAAAQDRQLDR